MGPPPLTNSDTTPRMEPDRIRTCEGAMPAVLQTVELLSGSLESFMSESDRRPLLGRQPFYR